MPEFKLYEKDLEALLKPYLVPSTVVPSQLYTQLATYLELLLKWNARTNLTAIRDPEEIVRRHFGESLFAAQHLELTGEGDCKTLLDFGSGAGFPGIPIQLFHPELRVTLAESQNKKAAFLREAVRSLRLGTEVWAARVEAMPASRQFEIVTLRAVDNMDTAIATASLRANKRLLLLTTFGQLPLPPAGFAVGAAIPLPAAKEQQLLWMDRIDPRED